MNDSGKLIGLEVAEELADLWLRHPDGLTIRLLAEHTGLPYHSAHAAAVWLADSRRAKWIRRPDRPSAMLVPLDWIAPAYDLTDKQQAIVDALISVMDEDCIAVMSFRQLGEISGVSAGSITAHLDALERKGYVQIQALGYLERSTRYRLYPEGDGPKGYSPARMAGQRRYRSAEQPSNANQEKRGSHGF